MRSEVLLLFLVFASVPTIGQIPGTSEKKATVDAAGRTLDYFVWADTLRLVDRDEEHRAWVFHVSYRHLDPASPAKRPVTFVFNGGPGSASLWLHLGGLGPRRVTLDDEGVARSPGERLVENPLTWLPFTDLVFIDPVGTGFSRPAGKVEQKEFSGYTEDIESVGDFIAAWLSKHGRWSSPKYLCGESYGTMRSAGLSGYLQDRHHVFLNGIVLISTVLDYGTKRFAPGHDLPYALHLPSFCATAWYHKKLPPELQQRPVASVVKDAERFALGDYLVALAQGDRLSDAARTKTVESLARYTGLSKQFLRQADLRVNLSRFTKELRRTDGVTVGRLDSRFTGQDRDNAGERYEFDPSMANIDGPFNACINHYLRKTLGYETTMVYESMSRRVRPWSNKGFENRYVSSADTLRRAMTKNPHLRVLVCSGYYDLATPYFAADYTFSHMGLPRDRRAALEVRYYEAGHMMYIRKESLKKLTADVAGWFAGAK